MSASDSAKPSMRPMTSAEAPSVPARYSGSSEWTSSLDVSISRLTNPSVHTPAGSEVPRFMARACLGLECGGQVARAGSHTGPRCEAEAARDQLQDRRRVVLRVVDVALLRERR